MPTNDEIIQKNKELINLWYGSFYMHYLKDLRILMNQARADTAKQIFAKIESIKDEYGIPLLDTLNGKGKQYAKLKKQHKVPL